MTTTDAQNGPIQNNASTTSQDRVTDPVLTQPCHGSTSWSNPATTPEAGTDQGAQTCATTASTPDGATESQLSLLPAAALTGLATPATAALWLLAATPATAAAWAECLGRVSSARQQGAPVLWADARELLVLWLSGQVTAGALDECSTAKYLAMVDQFIDHCVNRNVVIPSVDVAERLGRPLAQAWVDDLGSDRRTKDPVVTGPAIRNQRRCAGRRFWYVLRLFGVTERDLFADVVVPSLPGGSQARPVTDDEALALRTWAVDHPNESAQNAALAGALLGASQATLAELLVCDIDLAQGIVRMPGHGKNRPRVLTLDPFATTMLTRRIEDIYVLHDRAAGSDVRDLHVLSSQGQAMTASNVGMLLRSAIEYAGVRSARVTPISLALWGSQRAYHYGPAATVLTSHPSPTGTRDIDAAAYVRGVSTRQASVSLGLATTDKGDDPYGIVTD